MRKTLAVALGAAVLLGGAAAAQNAGNTPKPSGYLPAGGLDPAVFLPAPPKPGSPAEAADKAAYAPVPVGSPRWEQAKADDSLKGIGHGFRCAVGVELTPQTAPTLFMTFQRVLADGGPLIDKAKALYPRDRPFESDPAADAPYCAATPRAELAASPSYPSGHAAAGYLFALMLAESAPDRASQAIARGLDFGESRIACRVHHPTDVKAGQLVATALFARLQAEPAFQADMDKARAEVAAARAASKTPPQGCPLA
ncbi:phosphatase PAP2 family protein [Caulobacter sp. 17J80-11]|uniref:acid phosphatase n=1 Tax=Caulobacter sp. 17J80-11 TaxID=2763502 RepID=UPI001653EA29|nr:phosphatase PAP2 family protein [Caulobacter sp. 17J80-11]MBC6983744.1 phosphatase PAP2 family protein [Caulobacter sp. 17J80-11]